MKWHIDPSKILITDKLVYKCIYYKNGQRWTEEYYLNGKLHNPNGLAFRSWYKDGRLSCEEYYLNDRFLSKQEHAKLTWYSNIA